ncbi:hypothetical protein OH77DRAFT_1247606 [Trametes cingulata]|nr:hypothetical protein OH77DRAFT_1247606 [Trametes cingulata]
MRHTSVCSSVIMLRVWPIVTLAIMPRPPVQSRKTIAVTLSSGFVPVLKQSTLPNSVLLLPLRLHFSEANRYVLASTVALVPNQHAILLLANSPLCVQVLVHPHLSISTLPLRLCLAAIQDITDRLPVPPGRCFAASYFLRTEDAVLNSTWL